MRDQERLVVRECDDYNEWELELLFDSRLPLLIILLEDLWVGCIQLISSMLDMLESSASRNHGCVYISSMVGRSHGLTDRHQDMSDFTSEIVSRRGNETMCLYIELLDRSQYC